MVYSALYLASKLFYSFLIVIHSLFKYLLRLYVLRLFIAARDTVVNNRQVPSSLSAYILMVGENAHVKKINQ